MTKEDKHLVNGYVSYSDKIQYKWITEPSKNTCEKCKSLNGKIFDKDTLPMRPHPNCRCRVEEISIVDTDIAKRYGYRDEKFNLEINAHEILGDLKVLRSKIYKDLDKSKFQEIIDKKEKLLHDISVLEVEVNQLINNLSELNNYSNKEIFEDKSMKLITYSSKRKDLFDQAEYLRLCFSKLYLDKLIQKKKFISEDAAALWLIASSKFKEGQDYIKKNGQIVNKVEELKDTKLEEIVYNKLKSQNLNQDSKGIIFSENSSLAIMLTETLAFEQFIWKNWHKLLEDRRLPNDSIHFATNIPSFFAVKRADIIDIHIDKDDIIRMKIIDTVDYNNNEFWVAPFHELQENGFIENYYIIVNIAIPLSKYTLNIDPEEQQYYNRYEIYPRSTSY